MKKKLMLSSAALLATVGLVACNNKTTTDKPAETKSGEKKTLKLAALTKKLIQMLKLNYNLVKKLKMNYLQK